MDNDNNVTILTLAKMANVSHTTISRALNDSPLVKKETKAKIQALAAELGYTPNINAKGLVEKQSFLIGVFFTVIDTGTSPSFLVDVISQTKRILPDQYSIAIDSISNYQQNNLPNGRYDGVIVVSQSSEDDDFIQKVIEQKVPLVVLNRQLDQTHFNVFNYATDDYSGAKMLLKYAIRLGHQKMGLIGGEPRFQSTSDRKKAFDDLIAEHNLQTLPQWIKRGDYLPKSGYVKMKELLTESEVPTCVFVTNDDMAVGAIRACNDLGFRVPEDISILGYDDMGYSKYLVPQLTTIRKPTLQLIENGVKALLELLQDKETTPRREIYMPALIVRESVKDLREL